MKLNGVESTNTARLGCDVATVEGGRAAREVVPVICKTLQVQLCSDKLIGK